MNKDITIKNRIYLNNAILIMIIVIILMVSSIVGVRSYYTYTINAFVSSKSKRLQEYYNGNLTELSLSEKVKILIEREAGNHKEYFEVYSKKGNILINSNGDHRGLDSDNINTPLLRGDPYESTFYKDTPSGKKLVYFDIPLKKYNFIVGYIRVYVDFSPIHSSINFLTILIIIMGVLIVGIAFLFSSILSRRIIIPVKELTEAAEIISTGNLDTEIKKYRNDEIGTLCDTINYMKKEIKKSNRAKDDFIASISHELRTPLAAIRGWSELLRENLEEEDRETGIDIINKETKRLSKLVDELLDFSKLEARRMELQFEKIDLNTIAIEVVDTLKKKIIDGNIKVHVALSAEACSIKGDSNRLKQVLINIIDNSLKFTRDNGNIYIKTNLNENFSEIMISDDGSGISAENLHKVTEKFFKGSSSKSGTGIGLALCKKIIDLHNGEMILNSVEGEGTSILLKFEKV